jgi:hypothetical protein
MSKASDRRKAKALSGTTYVYIVEPDELLDSAGNPWSVQTGPGGASEEMGLLDVILHTVRKMPYDNFEDAEKGRDIVSMLNEVGQEDKPVLKFTKGQYDWLLSKWKANGHKIWNGPDAVELYYKIEQLASTKKPPEDKKTEESPVQ